MTLSKTWITAILGSKMSQRDNTRERPNQASTPIETVSDPEAYNRSQRFKEIHRARQNVSKQLSEIEFARDGQSYNAISVARLAHLVAVYIIELEPLIIESEYNDAENFPNELPYDSLRDFAYKLGFENRRDNAPMPSVTARVYSVANQFYAKVGMDLDIEDREQTTKIDNNLLEEVDEWRQKNVE